MVNGSNDEQSGAVAQLLSQGRHREAITLVYDELRMIAAHLMRGERTDHTLQATALVNEACARMLGGEQRRWDSRAAFYKAAADSMRRVLIDHARARGALKRGRGAKRLPLSAVSLASLPDPSTLLSLDEAFLRLERQEPYIADIVRFRFYMGMSSEQTAEILGQSVRTVQRDWQYARAWFLSELGGTDP